MADHVQLTIPDGLSAKERVAFTRGQLYGVVAANRVLIRSGLVPAIYDSGVRYAREIGPEEFADALTCYRRGVGDCDDLVPWRVAELWEEWIRRGKPGGKAPGMVLYLRDQDPHMLVHVQARHAPSRRFPNGKIEDVCRLLGMADMRLTE